MEENKKKKNPMMIVGVVIAFVVLLVGYFILSQNKTNNSTGKGEGTGVVQEEKGKGESIISSIRDAMSKSMSLKCTYEVGSQETVAYVKGNKIRVDNKDEDGKTSSMIMKDNKMWIWSSDREEEGIILSTEGVEGEQKITSSEDIIANLEDQRQFCKVDSVSDSYFEPPQNVNFKDMSDLMKGLQGAERE